MAIFMMLLSLPSRSVEIMHLTCDTRGALSIRASATSSTGGVFGVVVPLANINSNATFYLPSFGGMRAGQTANPSLRTYGGAPFFEAPVMAAESGRGSVALWCEDEQFYRYFTFFNWSGKSFAFGFEHLNLMPFEPHKEISSATWKLDVSDGGWMAAMTPYREWYQNLFAEEIKIRDSVDWADKIQVIIDDFVFDRKKIEQLAESFSPETVMLHQWTARKEGRSGSQSLCAKQVNALW